MLAHLFAVALFLRCSGVVGLSADIRSLLQRAGCRVVDKSPSTYQAYSYEVLSVRSGSSTEPRGLQTHCDWVVSWDGVFHGVVDRPRTICVGTRAMSKVWKILADWKTPFVLVTMGGDQTTPLGILDNRGRYPGYGLAEFESIMKNPSVLHMFSENHDMNHSKLSTLPTGFADIPKRNPGTWYTNLNSFMNKNYNLVKPLDQRDANISVIVVDRIREGTQYIDRRLTREWCTNVSFCKTGADFASNQEYGDPKSHDYFLSLVVRFRFIICTHGGGIDPSPKAWENILLGTIPIIQHSTLDDAYIRMPVVIVPSISGFFEQGEEKCREQLNEWLARLAPFYSKGPLREQVLYSLTTEYWKNDILVKYYSMMNDTFHEKQHLAMLNYSNRLGKPLGSIFSGQKRFLRGF